MKLERKKAGRLAALVLSAGLLVRLGYAWRGAHALPTSNDQYETIAISVVERGEFAIEPGKPTSGREPVYPLFIALIYKAFGERPAMVIFFQCILSVMTGLFVWLTGRKLFDEVAALAALVVFTFYPQSIYYSAYFFRETILCLSFAVMLWACTGWRAESGDPEGDRGALWGGLAATVFGMANSAVLPACALSGLLILLVAPSKTRLRRFVLYTAPLVLAFGAWTARNYQVHHRFIAGSTHGGEEFYRALLVPPDQQNTPAVEQILGADPLFKEVAPLSEAERNVVMGKASFRWIGAHKGEYVGRVLGGVMKFWKLWPYRMTTYGHSYAILVAVSLLSDGWIIPLGFLALWLFRARWRELPVLPASVFALTAVYGAVHAVIRYRLPLMAGMILLACAAVFRQLSRRNAAA
ncbi:MAG: glycosyltransferase family 39 protein [Elusimicrobiota bacterium]